MVGRQCVGDHHLGVTRPSGRRRHVEADQQVHSLTRGERGRKAVGGGLQGERGALGDHRVFRPGVCVPATARPRAREPDSGRRRPSLSPVRDDRDRSVRRALCRRCAGHPLRQVWRRPGWTGCMYRHDCCGRHRRYTCSSHHSHPRRKQLRPRAIPRRPASARRGRSPRADGDTVEGSAPCAPGRLALVRAQRISSVAYTSSTWAPPCSSTV